MKHWNPKLLEQLLLVQDTDLEIRKLELQVQLYNQRSKEEDGELSRIKTDIGRIDEAVLAAESQNQMYSTTLEDIRAAIKGLLTTKTGVPKPRTRSSTEALKIEEEKLESLVEETDEQVVRLKEEREVLVERAQDRTAELETSHNGPEAEIRKFEQQIHRLKKQREEKVENIPPLLLKHYDRLRSSRSGIGLTILRNGVCTVCCMQMPTAIISKLSHGEKISMCPACGRMVARIEHIVAPEQTDEADEATNHPSRKLKKVKAARVPAVRTSADDRKAALKKTLKKSMEKRASLGAASAEEELEQTSGPEKVTDKKKKKAAASKKETVSAARPSKKAEAAAKTQPSKAEKKAAEAKDKAADKTAKDASGVKDVPKAPAKKQGASKTAKKVAAKTSTKKTAAKKTAKTVSPKAADKKAAPAKAALSEKSAAKKASPKKPAAKKTAAKKTTKSSSKKQ